MDCLYHHVPDVMEGSILYPLNTLKSTFPHVYEKEVAKYRDREALLRVRIPILDCLWNDVLHLAAVHPRVIKQALTEAGRPDIAPLRYYCIDPSSIDARQAVVYWYLQDGLNDILREDNFSLFDPSDLARLAVMPEATKEYYRTTVAQGKRPLLFHRIPHVLYRGTLDTSQLEILTV